METLAPSLLEVRNSFLDQFKNENMLDAIVGHFSVTLFKDVITQLIILYNYCI